MATIVPPKKNTAFVTWVSLISRSGRPQFQTNPTLAAGDVKVSIDGGALANLGTLPVVTPAGSALVKVTLSTAEMNGDVITVIFQDAAGAEWDDLLLVLHTSTRDVDDLAYPTTSGRSMDVDASGGVEVGSIAANAVDANALATDAAQEIASTVRATLTAIRASVLGGLAGSAIIEQRGDTWRRALEDLGSVTGYTSLWLTIKTDPLKTPDGDALIQVKKNASGLNDGLLTVNGAAASSAALGSLTINDATSGDITYYVDETITDDLAPGRYYYDIQMLNAGDTTTLVRDTFVIEADVTRAVS